MPKDTANVGVSTVADLSKDVPTHNVYSKELDSMRKYQLALGTHINATLGERLAELLTREAARGVMEAAEAMGT